MLPYEQIGPLRKKNFQNTDTIRKFYFGMVPKRYFDKRDRRDTCVFVLYKVYNKSSV